MLVHHTLLSATALQAVVAEFVTRDGTDHSAVDCRIAAVMAQLDDGRAEIQFDDETKTCNIVLAQ